MTPEQLQMFEAMQVRIKNLEQGENVAFIENVKRRIDMPSLLKKITLNDLANVSVPAPTNGQVLKFTTTGVDRWIASTDNV